MYKTQLILGIVVIIIGLLGLLFSPFFLLLVALGVASVISAEKKKKTEHTTKQAPKRPVEEYTYITLDADEQDYDYAEKFYRENKDVLDENDDYNLPKKELLEYYSGKIYRYDPSDFDC